MSGIPSATQMVSPVAAGAPAHDLSALFDLEDQAEELLQLECYEDAIQAAQAALAIDPKSLTARLACAQAQKALGRFADAVNMLKDALAHMPGLATVHADIAALYVELESLDEARDHLIRAVEIDPSLVQAVANLGSVYIRMARWDLAEAATRHALSLDAGNLVANRNFVVLQAERHGLTHARQDEGSRRQTFLVEKAYQSVAPVVLILSSTGKGNVPHQHLFPRSRYTRIFWFLEGDLPAQESEIPAHDIVFNAVGDPDAAPEAHALARRFAQTSKCPVVNLPDRVGNTSRDEVTKLLAACETAVIPQARKIERSASASAQNDPDLRFPLIARPAGRHGGEGAVLIDRPEQFACLAPDAPVIYATEFVDYRSLDGWYRKYRVIFIDRKPYPYHLAIGAHWLLHHWTSGMEEDARRRAEEEAYLADPEHVLGDKAWAALLAIGEMLDLDYAGIDFSVLQDGRLVLFEANPTMLVHPEDDPLFSYKNAAVANIIDAFDRMIGRTISHCGA